MFVLVGSICVDAQENCPWSDLSMNVAFTVRDVIRLDCPRRLYRVLRQSGKYRNRVAKHDSLQRRRVTEMTRPTPSGAATRFSIA